MLLRKINAGIGILITVLLLGHTISNGVWMLSMGKTVKSLGVVSWILFWLMMAHAILSIVHGVRDHKASKNTAKQKPDAPTIIQRATGVALIVFTVLHVLEAVGVMTPPQPIHAVFPPLFYAISLIHTAVSGSKAMITLGIGNAKTVKAVDIIVKVLCAVTLIADVVGFYLYLCS
jgi:succinate dehydrogenase hydrophobic anchor subunit